jgi:hypothetical protein
LQGIFFPATTGDRAEVASTVLYLLKIDALVARRMSDQPEQDSNPGGWRKGRFITLAGQHLDLFKNITSPIA